MSTSATDHERVRWLTVESLGFHREYAQVVRTGHARQPRATDNRDRRAGCAQADPPAEKRIDVLRTSAAIRPAAADSEDAGILEEEFALLRKDDVEACEVDLLLIGL